MKHIKRIHDIVPISNYPKDYHLFLGMTIREIAEYTLISHFTSSKSFPLINEETCYCMEIPVGVIRSIPLSFIDIWENRDESIPFKERIK